MDIFCHPDNKIHLISQSRIEEILQDNANFPEDPFMILNPGELIESHKIWVKNLPRVLPFYAFKCNNDMMLLKTLASLGVGFDCASEHELQVSTNLGVPPQNIIFANTTKQGSHIRTSARLGISMMTFDNEEEIAKIKGIYPTAELVVRLRFAPKDTLKDLGTKFGVPFSEAMGLLVAAKKLDMKVIGLSFHLGTDLKDPKVFHHAIKSASTFFQVAAEIGHDFTLLDIGGGFPGTFGENEGPSMEEFGDVIGQVIDKYFPVEKNVRIIAEPGRYYATPSCTLVTRVHSIRKVEDNKFWYYINDGTFGSLNSVYRRNAILKPTCFKDTKDVELFECSIWGPTCDSADKLFSGIYLPKLVIGDRMLFRNAGAYSLSAGGTFNGFPMPTVVYVADAKHWPVLEKLLPTDVAAEECPAEECADEIVQNGENYLHGFVNVEKSYEAFLKCCSTK